MNGDSVALFVRSDCNRSSRMASEKAGGFQRRGQAWLCTSGLASDVVIEVEEMSFHLHKFPLMARCGRLARELEMGEGSGSGNGNGGLELRGMPGGAGAFEMAARFCYGERLALTATNVTALRCAAEYLEMFGEGNLVSKTEGYLNHIVLRSWKDSVHTLQSCEGLMPVAEELSIVKRCVDSIAMKACTDPTLFGWPMPMPLRNTSDWWYDDVALLSLPFYQKVIVAMESKGIRHETIAGAVMYYANKFIPGLTRRQGISTTLSFSGVSSDVDQREFLETIETLLPQHRADNTVKFLFGLLRTANILNTSESCKRSLERRIGFHLEHASLDDLLMPSYSYTVETLYDIDCVERVLQHFLSNHQGADTSALVNPQGYEDCSFMGSTCLSPMVMVGKLLDGYLAEVAPDGNLKPAKFKMLAESLPDYARLFDDGLYRAIDIYLKAHPWVTEEEREKICSVMDCQKLTLEACTHAAQNERLPLRVVVQVLFFEQLQLRNAIAGSFLAGEGPDPSRHSHFNAIADLALAGAVVGGDGWNNAAQDNQVLKTDIDTMRSRVHELERACSTMRHAMEKIDKPKGGSKNNGSSWNFMSKKFGCKFRMQVCESQERKVVYGKNINKSNIEAMRRARHKHKSSLA